MIKNKLFSLEEQQNSVDLLYDDDDISIASIDLFHIDEDGECNRNKCNISRETAERSLQSIKNKPIIARFNSVCKDFVTDVTEHARNENEAFNMRVVGTIPSDSRITFVERDNGKTYCNAEAIIYKKYVPQLVNILKKSDGSLKVSIEIKAKGQSNDENIFVIDSFNLEGVTLLGAGIIEGIEGSHMQVLKFSQSDTEILNEKYLQFSQSKESNRNIFDEIKNKIKKEETQILNSLGVNDLRDKIWNDLDKYTYHDGEWEGKKYYVEEIYPDDKEIVIRDNETAKYYKVPYSVDNGDVKVKITSKIEVEKGWHERPLDNKRFSLVFAKEEYGTGEKIKVDKSKEALSDKAWGDVDKTELRHKVLQAKNYKSLVHDVYAEVENGWEDAPSEKLKYPIMLIEGDTAVYARYGLASALGYAKKENNTSVVNKVEKLYKAIDIQEKEEKMDGEKELQNKVDKHNPELEKIRDDADAMEDDKKEELRKKEVENAVVDAPEEDKLKDDIDSDKDYWKKQYSELEEKFKNMEAEFSNCQEELRTYKAKEDKTAMREYLHSFRKCFSDEELKVMASKIENAQRCEFEKEVDDKVKEFARKMSECDEPDEEDVEIKNSRGNMFNPQPSVNTKSSSANALDNLVAKYGEF